LARAVTRPSRADRAHPQSVASAGSACNRPKRPMRARGRHSGPRRGPGVGPLGGLVLLVGWSSWAECRSPVRDISAHPWSGRGGIGV